MDCTSLGQVADHSSVCRSGRIWSTILRICWTDNSEQYYKSVGAIKAV